MVIGGISDISAPGESVRGCWRALRASRVVASAGTARARRVAPLPVGGLGRTPGDRRLVRRHTVAGRAPADCGQPAGLPVPGAARVTAPSPARRRSSTVHGQRTTPLPARRPSALRPVSCPKASPSPGAGRGAGGQRVGRTPAKAGRWGGGGVISGMVGEGGVDRKYGTTGSATPSHGRVGRPEGRRRWPGCGTSRRRR